MIRIHKNQRELTGEEKKIKTTGKEEAKHEYERFKMYWVDHSSESMSIEFRGNGWQCPCKIARFILKESFSLQELKNSDEDDMIIKTLIKSWFYWLYLNSDDRLNTSWIFWPSDKFTVLNYEYGILDGNSADGERHNIVKKKRKKEQIFDLEKINAIYMQRWIRI